MKLIRIDGQFINVDPQHCEPGYVWGQRWNRNEQAWGLCMLYKCDKFMLVTEADLPKALDKID